VAAPVADAEIGHIQNLNLNRAAALRALAGRWTYHRAGLALGASPDPHPTTRDRRALFAALRAFAAAERF